MLLPLLDPVLEAALGYRLPQPHEAAGELALSPRGSRQPSKTAAGTGSTASAQGGVGGSGIQPQLLSGSQ